MEERFSNFIMTASKRKIRKLIRLLRNLHDPSFIGFIDSLEQIV